MPADYRQGRSSLLISLLGRRVTAQQPGNAVGQTAGSVVVPTVDRESLSRLEAHFIAPEIYGRNDITARQAKLAHVVSNEIVPRLLHLHTEAVVNAPPLSALLEALVPHSTDVRTLADIVLGANLDAAAAYVLVLRDRGLSMETLFVELLEPTARHLGEMWERDECDFVDVTLGVARLQKLLAIFNATYAEPAFETRRHVLLASMPGDQHRFGVTMVERFLSAAGWHVRSEFASSVDEVAAAARGRWFAAAGLTAGSDRQLEALRSAIVRLREQSQNPAIGIMVGGPMFTANPALAFEVGADATAPDAPTAVLVAQKLLDLALPRLRAPSSGPRGET